MRNFVATWPYKLTIVLLTPQVHLLLILLIQVAGLYLHRSGQVYEVLCESLLFMFALLSLQIGYLLDLNRVIIIVVLAWAW